ncbi:MAG: hypothetical protein ACLUD2_04115 [Clostridium sp.]
MAINEAVNLAKKFGGKDSPAFHQRCKAWRSW